jgi:hypothetical protein
LSTGWLPRASFFIPSLRRGFYPATMEARLEEVLIYVAMAAATVLLILATVAA